MKQNSLVPELSVTNYNKTLDFYVNILGFTIEYSREDEGFAFLSLGESQLMIDEIDKGRTWKTNELVYPLGRGINFQIEVDNLDVVLNNVRERDITLFMEPEEKWYQVENKQLGNKQFLVQDPDGYLLRFFKDLGEK